MGLLQDPPVITFLSDYGLSDEFVGVCHGVIARRCPRARVIDITHGVAPGDVLAGAVILRDALPYLPVGVHVAVVDPTVGTAARRAVVLRTAGAGRVLVGPDNGLLWPAAESAGGVERALVIDGSAEVLEPVSSTFHGRDVFAPVAAALADGLELERAGVEIAVESLARLTVPGAQTDDDGALTVPVLRTDRFGNVILGATAHDLDRAGIVPGAVSVRTAIAVEFGATRCATFADVPAGELLVYEDSTGRAALAVNGGSARALLEISSGQQVTIRGVSGTIG